MADTAEILRLMRHAADLLEDVSGTAEKLCGRLAERAYSGGAERIEANTTRARLAAASALATNTLRLVASFMTEVETTEATDAA